MKEKRGVRRGFGITYEPGMVGIANHKFRVGHRQSLTAMPTLPKWSEVRSLLPIIM
ncbi:MAG: hypothetical protein AB4426_09545 [Xenococcaceae cyanobacterium]